MTPSLPVPPVPGIKARPVDSGDRLVLLDALRGFALCGVFVSNVTMWFSGRAFLPREKIEAMMSTAPLVDVVTTYTVSILVFGKFLTIFAFLFGLGFSVQLHRADERGASVVSLYARRLGVMLTLGLAHLFLLWYGDILSTYAVLGFGLLLFYRRQDRTLIIWALLLIFVAPALAMALQRLPELLGTAAAAEAAKQAGKQAANLRALALAAFEQGRWLDVVEANVGYFFGAFLPAVVISDPAIFGRFLLGLLVGRLRLLHDAAQHLHTWRRVLGWGVAVGVLSAGVIVTFQQLMLRKILSPDALPTWLPLVMNTPRQLGELGLAAVYVSGFTLLFQRAAWQRVLTVLAPVGRMALTNYLAQTVISVFIFYGYGLGRIGKVSPFGCLALCLGIFSLQVAWSHLWLSRFRFGPAEWLWRSLTYGKAQPMRRSPPSVAEPAAV